MGLSKLQTYYQKMIGQDSEELTEIICQRNHWHRLFKDNPPGKIAVTMWKKSGRTKKKVDQTTRAAEEKKMVMTMRTATTE